MAAARESCSSEEEEAAAEAQRRFREAASWAPEGAFQTSRLPSAEPSIRRMAEDHGQDGNELQTTPEFRAHVAKKLGAILDGSITILEQTPGPLQTSTGALEAEDDGFRLFSSSVPGDCGKPDPSPLRRRRLQQSSSSELDSDQELERCREAAVSAADIQKLSGFVTPLQGSSQGRECQATEPRQRKRRKKKRKKTAQANEEDGSEHNVMGTRPLSQAEDGTEKSSCINGVCKNEEGTERAGDKLSGQVTRRKKKKKKHVEERTE
ncbi:protein CUSTOS isoform X2 [Hemicordylus capensis]|uniref:protein CUSTOS isoform X2 n=1 Tax=Hemicordylus capensis TaxID=884348 RepID=UPI002304762D|nr:protein CUSTOS isoform X2 [Hemicordylus capensis]